MYRVGATQQRRADDVGDVQVAALARPRAHADGFIGQHRGQRVAVRLRVRQHRQDAQLAAGADHPHRDLATIGDQDLLEHASPELNGARSTLE
jgi:hypothetical protein